MNKQMKIILCAVMIAAVVLVSVCGLRYLRLGRELRFHSSVLAESRANWERIAAEKEPFQTELKEKQTELNRAELSYSELTEKADKLKTEIDTLKADIESLQKKLDSGE